MRLKKAMATSHSPFIIFFLTAAIAIVYIFYLSAVREHVENYLYDVRTVLKPKSKINDIVILAIDEASIAKLAARGAKNISYATLVDLTRELIKSDAKEIVVLPFANIFSSDALEVEDLKKLVQSESRLTVGTLNLYNNLPSGVELPSTFAAIDERVYGLDALRKRSNSVVRWLPFFGFQGQNLKPLLPYYIANKILGRAILREGTYGTSVERDERLAWYLLNYTLPANFQEIRALDFATSPERYQQALKDKIVLLGYTAFREWPTQTRDQMAANTPLQGQVDTYRKGTAIIYIAANAISNVLHHAWLEPVPRWVNVVQVVVVSFLFGFIWFFGVVPATVGIFAGWGLLLFGHGFVFEYLNLFLPLSDTALFSSFALIIGALWRLNVDVKAQTEIRAKTLAKADLAALQSSFLDRFAFELAAINETLMQKIRAIRVGEDMLGSSKSLLQRALASSEDFSEYLEGIKQSAALEGAAAYRPTKSRIAIASVIGAVLPRFETKIDEKNLQVEVDCESHLCANSDAKILDTIVYNLVSNAIKYSPKNAAIMIAVKPVSPNKLVISVRDHGPGIAKEHWEMIFEKFYRVKDDHVYSVKGTGLGLYLCRYFARQIDARVWCESVQGSWSLFCLEVERA